MSELDEKIVEFMLEDLDSYRGNIIELISSHFNDNPDIRESWIKWFSDINILSTKQREVLELIGYLGLNVYTKDNNYFVYEKGNLIMSDDIVNLETKYVMKSLFDLKTKN